MKRIFFTLIGILFISSNILSQTSDATLAKLINKVWVYHFLSEKELPMIEIRFSSTEENIYYTSETWESGQKFQFYLSNEKDKTFDTSKVGNVYNGKYIIVKEVVEGNENIGCYEIIELTSSILKLKDSKTNISTITLYCH